ncbi:hypothetical protein [Pseudodesulfovibrio profundus]|uniref:hypothetical protein n=1 Tax=Pseudodesulfovibrio profundus TaxID=57320 RepID=UPI000BE2B6A7|nr:hypothetical protein [Pseudodesulfovibrio profundus]
MVFYYQSPNGGRVFFDELGPPWPKHPCTVKYKTAAKGICPSDVGREVSAADYSWGLDGWEPYVDIKCRRWEEAYVVTGLYKRRKLELKFKSNKLKDYSKNMLNECLWMAKVQTPGSYDLSICNGKSDFVITGDLLSAPAQNGVRGQRFGMLSKKIYEVRHRVRALEVACSLCGNKEIYGMSWLLSAYPHWTRLVVIRNEFQSRRCRRCQALELGVSFLNKKKSNKKKKMR